MAKQSWYAEQGYNKAPGARGMLQRAMPGGKSGWNEPTWWDAGNMSDFTEEDWQKFNEDDPDYAYKGGEQGVAFRGEHGDISREEGIARSKSLYGPITRDINNDGKLDLDDRDPNYQSPAPGETPWWKNETPILNQSGTYRGNPDDYFEDYPNPFPDDIGYNSPLGEAMGGNRFGGGSVGEGGFQPGDANAGRFGDNMMRNVGGEESHVNPQEARLIDNYGSLGQSMVKNVGSGTINPRTGKREFAPIPNPLNPLAALGGLAQGVAGIYGAHKMGQASKAAMAGQQQSLGAAQQYGELGQSFLDPQSAQNQMYLKNIESQGMNQVALQNQMAQRNAAAYGGGFSGALAQQGQQAGLQTGLQGRQQWLGMMGQQQQTGLGMMNAANQQQQGIRDTMGELGMAGAAGQAQMMGGAAKGFSGGLLDYLGIVPPSVKAKAGGKP